MFITSNIFSHGASPYFRAAQYWGTRGFFHQLIDPRRVVYSGATPRYGLQYANAMPLHQAEHEKAMDESLARQWLGLLPEERRVRLTNDATLWPDGQLTRGAFLKRLSQLTEQAQANGRRVN